MDWQDAVRAAALLLFPALLLMVACEASGPPATSTPPPTPPPGITAERLYAEREANATRFDLNYKDNWVTITGLVGKVDGGEVRLVVDMDEYQLLGGLFLDYVALKGLSQEEQASADVGREFTAVCEVGNYIMGTMSLEKCREGAPVAAQPRASPNLNIA